jgi:septal ring factor EnvC (AmiA/AmiB activator)
VEQVNPDLVLRDKDGKAYSVRYEQVNAMLLNEFLKEHRKVQEQDRKIEKQEAKIAQQQKDFQSKFGEQEKQIAALTSGLQKMSARILVSTPEPAMAANNY